jgi:hypothetical protein
MKKKLFLLFGFLLFVFNNFQLAFAGLPSEDELVKKAKDSFDLGLPPEDQDLYLGVNWNCKKLSAIKGTQNTGNVIEQSYYNFIDVGIENHIGNQGKGQVSLFEKTKLGLQGMYRKYENGSRVHYLQVIRAFKTESKHLITEWSILGDDISYRERLKRIKSTVNNDYYVSYYLDCTPQ